MTPITLPALGAIPVRVPPSFAAISDLILSVPSAQENPSPAQRAAINRATARMSAAAIGLCIDWEEIQRTSSSSAQALAEAGEEEEGSPSQQEALQRYAWISRLEALRLEPALHYDPLDGDIYRYGTLMLAHLLKAGISLSLIIREGSRLSASLGQQLPTEARINAAVDFT